MNKLYNIKDELSQLKDWYNSSNRSKNRSIILEKCVRLRLNKSIEQYSDQVDKICNYLKRRSKVKVLHQLSLYNKKRMKKYDKTK